MDHITFGRYSPYNSFIHKMDPRNKIVLLILLIVSIFFQFTLWSTALIISGTLLLFLIVFFIVSHTSLSNLLKSFLGMWFLILVLLIIYLFVPNSTYQYVMVNINGYKLYWDSLFQWGYIILRIVMMIGLTMILTSTTKPMDLTYGLEWYMTPLKVIKFPAHEIAMTISIALRFIPTILDETSRIMKAQESRGVDFSRGRLFKRIKALTSLIIPLLISAFQRSDELADAMEARGYDPKAKRSRYRTLRFSLRDLFGFILVGCIFGGVLTLFIFDKSGTPLDIIKVISGWFGHPITIGW